MKGYTDLLREAVERKGTLLCFGMDPVIERMKVDRSEDIAAGIYGYFSRILHAISDRVSAVKPNLGFYLQYGLDGISALLRLVRLSRSLNLPVIIDGKIGDIGRTSAAYAGFIFDQVGADAVTLNPYMGYDALAPFFEYDENGFYVLALTSNPGARDFQYSRVDSGAPLYDKILREICAWNRRHNAVGAVIGATHREFGECLSVIRETGCELPLLVPGVGAQGASYGRTLELLNAAGYDSGIVRINASSAVSYAHEKYGGADIEEAALKAVNDILAH
jgi:orotidine 5'-phosphate decarboxylase subfamily 2